MADPFVGEGTAGADVPPVVPEGIAILGSHPATVMQAPFDHNWLIWACSPHNYEKNKLPRWDEWFEVHIPVAHQTRAYPYLRWLESAPAVWMRDKNAMGLFPGAKPYPEEQLKSEFGPYVFTSSIAYMIALAIKTCEERGIGAIGLWGIMQASPNEYTSQRPGIQHLVWEAVRRGIEVLAPPESKLFDPPADDW